jgi:copper(I)-binding protein
LRILPFLLALLTAMACEGNPPPLLISDVEVYRPVPGNDAAVAYLKLSNQGNETVRLSRVSSPQYGSVVMHETSIEDDIARMRPIDELVIDARSEVRFESGGKHLMLMRARGPQEEASPVTLEFHYGEGGLMIINTTLRSRPGH